MVGENVRWLCETVLNISQCGGSDLGLPIGKFARDYDVITVAGAARIGSGLFFFDRVDYAIDVTLFGHSAKETGCISVVQNTSDGEMDVRSYNETIISGWHGRRANKGGVGLDLPRILARAGERVERVWGVEASR